MNGRSRESSSRLQGTVEWTDAAVSALDDSEDQSLRHCSIIYHPKDQEERWLNEMEWMWKWTVEENDAGWVTRSVGEQDSEPQR